MSGIMVSTQFAYIMTIHIGVILLVVTYLQGKQIISVDQSWRATRADIGDIMVYIITLFIILIVSWLYNREIAKSLRRARQSETALKQERDSLEIKVIQRTEALRKAQLERVVQLYRFAEFGRLSSGLFHDLTNHLTALSLNLEKANEDEPSNDSPVQSYIQRAYQTSQKMEHFLEAVQKQLKKQDTQAMFDVSAEVKQVLEVFQYRSRKEQIPLNFRANDQPVTYGNVLKFNQALTNIISNALDAYRGKPNEQDTHIEITLAKNHGMIHIRVIDQGVGIPPAHLDRIFDPFFTTKDPDHGTGIGLSTTKEIIEKSFGGTIHFTSREGFGTECTIRIPIRTNEH